MSSSNDSRPRRTYQSIQSARGIAALLVAGYHLTENCELRYCDTQYLGVLQEFAFCGVDLFFVISGIVMVVISYDQLGTRQGGVTFLWRRVRRIYPLYWIITSVLLTVMLIVPALSRRNELTMPYVIASYVLLPQSTYPILAPGWTLVFEMFFYLAFTTFFLLPRRTLPYVLAAWSIATIVSFFAYDKPEYSDTTSLLQLPIFAFPLTLEFIAGCCIGLLIRRHRYNYAIFFLVAGALWFLVGGTAIEWLLQRDSEFGAARVLSYGVASSLLMYGLVARESQNESDLQPSRLTKLGDASYSLYLTHMLVMHGMGVVWTRLNIEGPAAQVLFLTTTMIACVAFAFLTYYLVERPLLRYRASSWTT